MIVIIVLSLACFICKDGWGVECRPANIKSVDSGWGGNEVAEEFWLLVTVQWTGVVVIIFYSRQSRRTINWWLSSGSVGDESNIATIYCWMVQFTHSLKRETKVEPRANLEDEVHPGIGLSFSSWMDTWITFLVVAVFYHVISMTLPTLNCWPI